MSHHPAPHLIPTPHTHPPLLPHHRLPIPCRRPLHPSPRPPLRDEVARRGVVVGEVVGVGEVAHPLG